MACLTRHESSAKNVKHSCSTASSAATFPLSMASSGVMQWRTAMMCTLSSGSASSFSPTNTSDCRTRPGSLGTVAESLPVAVPSEAPSAPLAPNRSLSAHISPATTRGNATASAARVIGKGSFTRSTKFSMSLTSRSSSSARRWASGAERTHRNTEPATSHALAFCWYKSASWNMRLTRLEQGPAVCDGVCCAGEALVQCNTSLAHHGLSVHGKAISNGKDAVEVALDTLRGGRRCAAPTCTQRGRRRRHPPRQCTACSARA